MPDPPARPTVATAAAAGPLGIVGAGQLARMLCEAASPLDLTTVVLAGHPDDAACRVATEVLYGSPDDIEALAGLASRCPVVTFDHEQVGLGLLQGLEEEGHALRPTTRTLAVTVDKAEMRRRFAEAGVPVPAFAVLDVGSGARSQLEGFAALHGWPLVVKAASGGYDGRGVWVVKDEGEAAEVVAEASRRALRLIVEVMVPFEAELAVLVARRPGGELATWPAVETAQVDGMCREILVPGSLPPAVAERATRLAAEVAELVGSVGVLAVEMFWSEGQLLVNELAARPHNSGHWTIEGAETSQFENHLRAVLDLPLGPTRPVAPAVATVNVIGGVDGADPRPLLGEALTDRAVHVHLYGKEPRAGRKLGHVTARGHDPAAVRHLAWEAAEVLGTPVPAGLGSG